jgi:phage terminase large subunit-like protein
MDRGDGDLVSEFIETYCRVTEDSFAASAGDRIKLRDWQKDIVRGVYARRPDGRRKHRRCLIGLPRKNAKSTLVSGFALHGLLMGGPGSQVYSLACDKDQAKIVFTTAKRMTAMDEQLTKHIQPYRDMLEVPATGSVYKALSSEAFSKEGLNPSMAVYDELHAAPNDELYQVITSAFGARRDPLLVAITTAGVKSDSTGQDSICYRLYQYGLKCASGEVDDPSFFFCWYGAPEDCNPALPETWEKSNPGFNDLLDPEDFASLYAQAEANGTIADFRTKRLNQWVSSSQAWLPHGAWNACYDPAFDFLIPPRGVVLGFDGSRNQDSTALVAVTVEERPRLKLLGLWEKPADRSTDWHVPRAEVMDMIRDCCRRWPVREVAMDEYLWVGEGETLLEEGIPVESFPQTASRMSPATQRFYEAVTMRRIRHDGDPRLARHLDNCRLKIDSRGVRVTKEHSTSQRKVDAAVAAIIGLDRAGWWNSEDAPGTFQGVPIDQIKFVY